MRVFWTQPALSNLEEIADYIAQDNPVAARHLAHRLHSATDDLLSKNPIIGRQGRDPETRELVIAGTNYIVAYRITGEVVEILAVIHGARQWPSKT